MYSWVLESVLHCSDDPRDRRSFPTRRSSDLATQLARGVYVGLHQVAPAAGGRDASKNHPVAVCQHLRSHVPLGNYRPGRSEEHTSELQSQFHLVCRLLLEKKTNP